MKKLLGLLVLVGLAIAAFLYITPSPIAPLAWKPQTGWKHHRLRARAP